MRNAASFFGSARLCLMRILLAACMTLAGPTNFVFAQATQTPQAETSVLSNSPQAAPAGQIGALPRDLSPWGMFMNADRVVKLVIIGLAFASVITWTIWLVKTAELLAARRAVHRAISLIGSAETIDGSVKAFKNIGGPAAHLVREAAEEMHASGHALDYAGASGLKERVTSRLSRIEVKAGRNMSRGTGLLATIGATAPFVGLFGTVWGIMNAFIGISQAQTTNLAVVAPGIAEALLATALGLVAAIPAVIIYNIFARSITGYRQLLADASAGIERLVSRELDFRKAGPKPGARVRAAE